MKDDIRTGHGNSLSENFASSAQRFGAIDVARYQKYLDGSDMTPEQKEDMLQVIKLILMTFAELGFRVHPLQEACGKDGETGSQPAKAAFDQVGSLSQQTHRTIRDSGPKGGLEVE